MNSIADYNNKDHCASAFQDNPSTMLLSTLPLLVIDDASFSTFIRFSESARAIGHSGPTLFSLLDFYDINIEFFI
jgi:hypothetical protein